MDLLRDDATTLSPRAAVAGAGRIFAEFGPPRQDSGNLSFGVETRAGRLFVKTTGDPSSEAPLSHAARADLLDNAARLQTSCDHPALARLLNRIASPWGPMLVYEWAKGELIGAPAERRGDASSAFQRFRALPEDRLERALTIVIEAHVALVGSGWIAVDFYDGSMIYDFAECTLTLVDLDHYSSGPFANEMDRMFGSSRFMAPEEFARGSRIDEGTTVYLLGRVLSVFLGDGSLSAEGFRGSRSHYELMRAACREDRAERISSVAELARLWQAG